MDRWVRKQKTTGGSRFLEEVILSNLRPLDRCFLYIGHEASTYLGCLLIDDEAFCNQVAKLLKCYYNHPIAEIGSLDRNPLTHLSAMRDQTKSLGFSKGRRLQYFTRACGSPDGVMLDLLSNMSLQTDA
jgi:hypothetical protein